MQSKLSTQSGGMAGEGNGIRTLRQRGGHPIQTPSLPDLALLLSISPRPPDSTSAEGVLPIKTGKVPARAVYVFALVVVLPFTLPAQQPAAREGTSVQIMEFYDSDVVILVTGQIGSGRSTFINSLLPPAAQRMAVGMSLAACTSDITCSIVDWKDRPRSSAPCWNNRLVLVDTPGFDNEEKRDRGVIDQIKFWLRKSYPAGRPRGGAIYMRDSKAPASDASILWESKVLGFLKSAMRGELCFVVTKAEEIPELQRSPTEIYVVEAQDHVKTCAGGQDVSLVCGHNVWKPVEYLFGRSEMQLLHDDMVLLVTGLTGSGKSTFVNALWKEPARHQMKVGERDSLLPCTAQLDYAIIDLKTAPGYNKDYRLVLVDTPGFGNPDKPFMSILEEIVAWLRESFPAGKCRGGIVYLHDITLDRFQAPPEIQPLGASLQWGSQDLHVVTTKWGLIVNTEEREKLKRTVNMCLAPISDGIEVHHCSAEEDSVDIINRILPELEKGSGFVFRPKPAHKSSFEPSRRSYEASISALIKLMIALLRVSGSS